ncbi:MAG: hypothetical protein EBQ96_04090 [Proteobacteria bacterium]|nr:hypothetical protein [Pseudomonadota bacterium]
MRKITLLVVACVLLSACAQKSDKIQAAYVSPLQYQDYSCQQIRGEISRVGRKMSEVAGVQDKTASNDAAAMGIGMVLFWPALFFIDSTDQRVELGRLKGEFDALEQAAIQKECAVAKEIDDIRKVEAARKLELEKQEGRNADKKRFN